MAGKGKSGKIRKSGGAKRHEKKSMASERTSITMGGIRRLARRGGIKRISLGVYEEINEFVDYFLSIVVKDSAVFC
jgi:histone H4